MKLKTLCIVFFVSVLQNASIEGKCFRAAVYEHQRYRDDIPFDLRKPEDIIDANVNVFENVSELAATLKSNIIVFPEDGLYPPPASKLEILPYLEQIPDEMDVWNPCDNASFANKTILRRLSCIAKKTGMYVVANMGDLQYCDVNTDHNCTTLAFYSYNTVVVFNNKGVIVAKYHKYHLFSESAFDVPKTQQFTTFKTPFGTFGTFICFDMIFKEPGVELIEKHKVNTIAFPTWWFDELPFLTAHQYHQAWAFKNNVNLLSANINKINVGSIGSGIFSGRRGAIAYRHETMGAMSTLIVAELPDDPKNNNSSCSPEVYEITIKPRKSNDKYHFQTIDLSIFNHSKLHTAKNNLTLCQHGFCCSLSYSRVNGLQDYYFVVGNRVRKLFMKYEWCEEMCALVAYNTNQTQYSLHSDSQFNHINLTAKFTTKYVYPSMLSNKLELVPTDAWKYLNNDYISSLEANQLQVSPVIAALYGRCYQKDPPYEDSH